MGKKSIDGADRYPVRCGFEVLETGQIRVLLEIADGPSVRMTQTVEESVDFARLILERAKVPS